jgi:hypothetical protein
MIVITPICFALNGEQKEKLIEPFAMAGKTLHCQWAYASMAKAVAVGVLHCQWECSKGKGRVGGGTTLSMARCNGNSRGCATLLMARCKGNGRGDAALSIGACYDGKGSGGGVHGALRCRMTTCKTVAFLLANDRRINDNQPAMGVDE